MKSLLVWVSLLSGIFLFETVLADIVIPRNRVTHHVNIYESDSSSSSEIGELLSGSSLPYVRSVPRWHVVELASGKEGFVSKSFTKVIGEIRPERAQNELRLHYINVGAGMCTVVECPGPKAPPMIIDCGTVGLGDNDRNTTRTKKYVKKILDAHEKKPNLVVSHPHKDHYGMIPEVLKSVQLNNIWLGGDHDRYKLSDFPDWLEKQKAGGAKVHNESPEDFDNDNSPIKSDWLGCGLASVYTLTVNSGDNPNSNSHILEIRYQDFGATFTGDAEGDTEEQALENYSEKVKTTVLSASHHGASTHRSNHEEWIKATDPEVVVFSSGPSFGHPKCNVVKRYDDAVEAAPPHPTRCGDRSGFKKKLRNTRAQFVTSVNGLIVVSSNGESPLLLKCDGSSGCKAEIAHD
ncbi:MAG: hypothetical protein GY815_11700 [Gammaproteobacteria bacterium]|nr:hypothetical protein [Gammaproteobacteria bacterium]